MPTVACSTQLLALREVWGSACMRSARIATPSESAQRLLFHGS